MVSSSRFLKLFAISKSCVAFQRVVHFTAKGQTDARVIGRDKHHSPD